MTVNGKVRRPRSKQSWPFQVLRCWHT